MIVEPLDTSQYPGIIAGQPNEAGTPRSTGTLHLSTIYYDLAKIMLMGRRDSTDPEVQEMLRWYAAGGWMWEHAFSLAFRESYMDGELVRTGEWELDGIVGSPDAIRISEWRIVELKARWMSAWKFDHLEKYFWIELLQVSGYCKMIGSLEAELHVWFVGGNWHPPTPMVRAVLLKFTQQEIDESWHALKSHAVTRGMLKLKA